jgi:hypothetical protein
MRAAKGDRLVVKGHRIGEPERDAEILDVRGAKGEPPYLVRWWDDGRVALVFPGPDAFVEHYAHPKRRERARVDRPLDRVMASRGQAR